MKVSELVRRDFCESNHLHKEVAKFWLNRFKNENPNVEILEIKTLDYAGHFFANNNYVNKMK